MSQNSFKERRDSVRVKRIVTVRHRINKRRGKKVQQPWQLSTTEDMSASGLLFASIFPYKVDDVIELQVVMSGVLDLFNGFGKVVRVIKVRENFYHIGIKYVDLKSKKRSAKSLIAR